MPPSFPTTAEPSPAAAPGSNSPARLDRLLQRVWGYSELRYPQGEVMQTLLAGQDALVVLPTGAGKSLCFQLPALLNDGLTLVISPLVALMENQVQELRDKGLPAAALHGQLSRPDRDRVLYQLDRQLLNLLYLSPEMLLGAKVWQRLIRPELKLSALILDEAHCLAQWGDSFRPTYRRLGTVRPALLKVRPPGTQLPIAAFTATADPTTQEILQRALQLESPRVFATGPYRPNLSLSVQTIWTPAGRQQQLVNFLKRNGHQSGLVYVRTRRDTEAIAHLLQRQGHLAAAYHGGLSGEERRRIEQDWLGDRLPHVVCTNAFGLGINKPNLRWVIHYHVPLTLAEYIQEVGRAGRDGQPAQALALVSEPSGWLDPTDRSRNQFFLDQIDRQQQDAQRLVRQIPTRGNLIELQRQHPTAELSLALLHASGQLQWHDPVNYELTATSANPGPGPIGLQRQAAESMQRYLQGRQCRWQSLSRAFGFERGDRCGHCDNCRR
jgi:ATP-dependent DNA helicase RecQ